MRSRARIAGVILILAAASALPVASAQAAAAPTTTRLFAAAGPIAGGNVVIVKGTDFTKVTKVWFGASAGTRIHVDSRSQLKVTAPAGVVGAVPVRVTAAGGTTPSRTAARYQYAAPPSIVLSATVGPLAGNTKIVITGKNLASVSTVTIAGRAQPVFYDLSTGEMSVYTEPHAEGAVTISVTTPGGTANAVFVYADAPRAVLTPSSGPAAGSNVTLSGTGLYGLSTVSFDGQPMTSPIFYGPAGITVNAPAHAPGTVGVTIVAAGGTQVLPYTYLP